MESDEFIKDYSTTDKLETYEELTEKWATGKHVYLYNINRLIPDVKGKVVLDLPCGIGHNIRELFRRGAAKIIASDIVSQQLEVSKEKDKQAGIPDGFVEYYQHDGKIPKRLSGNLADFCLSIHFFCFAENEDELRKMSRTILANLKPGGRCLIVTCFLGQSAGSEQELRKALKVYREEVVHLDPQTFEVCQPRRFHTTKNGFNLNRFVWPQEAIYKILQEEGFSNIELIPFEVDPTYEGDLDLQAYIDIYDYRAILACGK